ncbi:MAG: bifunctional 4-hydroxy-2-oxoglutarate aldolase/2-dehydro-3-deoxy-phosphogluconate aldolase [Lentisphaerae bacterium]|jgi:2-dehydro-3-deoxyphosphogluconate aldolase/(4S)-4-hydroxy-2-oxoglutarate aldolase|nr:bifunctional 4-hydroxy-2-oxoglutarate aldolase/2-dehydro-3-deoxy-phosphogluconate aldolase [Lentisphaerota bacterium]
MESKLEKALLQRIVPVVVIESEAQAEPLAEALLRGGLPIMEVTFRTAAAAGAIRRVAAKFPEMCVGAGTLLTADQVAGAVDAGAVFGVAPGFNFDNVKVAQERGLPFMPGVMTPSEIEAALALGLRTLKFFPAEAAGGAAMLKALAGPYAHTGVKFVPTGGVSARNMADYLALPVVAAIGGSWMVEKSLISGGRWDEIERLTREALAAAGG